MKTFSLIVKQTLHHQDVGVKCYIVTGLLLQLAG